MEQKGIFMEEVIGLLAIAAVILICVFVIRLLFKPMKLILKLAINTGCGFVILFIVNFIGEFFDFTLGVSLFNALVAGILGVPGVILLILFKLFFI